MTLENYQPKTFLWSLEKETGVASLVLNRPQRKNAITFEGYQELRDLFQSLAKEDSIKALVISGAEGNFSTGGDVHEILGALVAMSAPEKLAFTRLAGDVVKAMRACPQPIIAAVDGACAAAGAMLAAAADMRFATPQAATAFLFVRVGLAGADMGACSLLPRLIGQGRAAELLFTGRFMSAEEGLAWGFYNRVVDQSLLLDQAKDMARSLAAGPTFAHATTKRLLQLEWSMSLDEAIETEAQAQALCLQTRDFERAYEAFVNRVPVQFQGN